jgi:dGTPase
MSYKGIRLEPKREKVPDRENIRPVFSHDSDRILHSHAYARYIDKTQAFYLFENDHITHRVLHVQLVSKIGRTIARSLQLNEDLVEAISLGHDLGHVPYGHDGEAVLNSICKEHIIGSFCHNAQSMRFLMDLENGGQGWNLSLQVLDGILAHNGEIINSEYIPDYKKDWNKLLYEYNMCMQDGEYSKRIMPMTLEGCVMRISDVIAYIGRDIEDAITLNVMKREEIPCEIVAVLGNTNREIIDSLILDLIENSVDRDRLVFSNKIFEALMKLKDFNYQRIYRCPRVRTESEKIKRMFRELFQCYVNDIKGKNKKSQIYSGFLDNMSSDYCEHNSGERIVVDFISGMTDDYFNNEYKKYYLPSNYGYRLDDIESSEASKIL